MVYDFLSFYGDRIFDSIDLALSNCISAKGGCEIWLNDKYGNHSIHLKLVAPKPHLDTEQGLLCS